MTTTTTAALASAGRTTAPYSTPTVRRDVAVLWIVAILVAVWSVGVTVGYVMSLRILFVLALTAALVGIARPAVGLIGASVLCVVDAPLRVYVFADGPLPWNLLSYWLLAATIVGASFILRLRDTHTRLVQLLFGLLAIGLLIGSDPTRGIVDLLNLSAVFGLLVYFSSAALNDAAWYRVGVTCGVLGALGGAVFFLQRSVLGEINANAWSYFPLSALFGTCLACVRTREPRRRLALALLGGVNVVWVFLSGSRGSLLVACACALFLILTSRGTWQRVQVVVMLAVIGFGIAAQFSELQQIAVTRVERLMNPSVNWRARTSGRSDLARGGWMLVRSHPFGVGTGGFDRAWRDLGLEAGTQTGEERPAHSAWVKLLAENGYMGVIALAGFVLSFVVVAQRTTDRDLRLLGGLTTVVLSLAFLATEFQAKGLWFLVAGTTTLLHSGHVASLLRAGHEASASRHP